jgi:NtrC-family two-component system response regulator AlgB
MNQGLQVMVIDDERNIRATLAVCLEGIGCRVTQAQNGTDALAALARRPYDLAFLDLRLEESSGLDLLPSLLAACPKLDVVIVTAYATVQTAVEAIQRGARDYVPKPFTPAQIRQLVERLAARRALEREVDDLRARLDEAAPEVTFETLSPRMRALLDVLDKAARHDVPVLLSGENGTGKSALARRVHQTSGRAKGPFVVVNCPTLSEELLASELFGHVRGAFTGAVRDQPGRVESADDGTLFLDEIGELSPTLQAKLLRFVQEKAFERVGENTTRTADVRIVAATNRDLPAEVAAGRFREDLLYRLNTFELAVPPLRQRREDIAPLGRRFLAFFARGRALELDADAEAALVAYAWPGNLRELRNAMERATILAPGSRIDAALLPERIVGGAPRGPWLGGDFTLDEIEREHILHVIGRYEKVEDAARALGIDASTLWRKRKRYER